MDVTLRIPDAIAAHLTERGEDLSRRALEGFALEELRAGRISELDEMLFRDARSRSKSSME